MTQTKFKITTENSAEWLASCGFLFPGNKEELDRFNQLLGPVDPSITGEEVDPFRILKESSKNSSSSKIVELPYQRLLVAIKAGTGNDQKKNGQKPNGKY